MYQPHPSPELKSLFARQPYQGAEPSSAKFLFIGLDANYDASIENTPIFQNVLEYHQDGVAFGVGMGFITPSFFRNTVVMAAATIQRSQRSALSHSTLTSCRSWSYWMCQLWVEANSHPKTSILRIFKGSTP